MNITVSNNNSLVIIRWVVYVWASFKMTFKIIPDQKIEQSMYLKLLVKLEKSAIDSFGMFTDVYKDAVMSWSRVFHSYEKNYKFLFHLEKQNRRCFFKI